MKSRRRSSSYSIDYVIKVLFILLLPTVILDIMISLYVISSMRTQTVQTLQDTTSLYISQIDAAHVSINKYLIRRLTDHEDFLTALETEDTIELIQASNAMQKDVTTFMESFDQGYQIFFYNQKNDRLIRPNGVLSSIGINELNKLNQTLISHMISSSSSPSYTDAWEMLSLDSKIYFFKIFHSGDNYAGCCISADDIIKPLKKINLGNDGFVSLTSKDGMPLTNTEKLQEYHISFSPVTESSPAYTYSSGQKLIISGSLTMGIFCPHIILNKFRAFERIVLIQFIMAGTVLLISIFLLSSVLYMKNRVLGPIKIFSENLSKIDDSSEILDLKDSRLIELEQANLQFKNLMRQIKKLKIDIYEKELEKQKTLMNYLQLQIRPHFFLNCLNTIYSMAQTQLYDEIMRMSMITSDYFRYLFRNGENFVPIRCELKHIENYMKIQKLRYGDRFSYEIYTEEGTTEVKILPILIQTFIENSLKHTAAQDEPITIRTDIAWAFANGNPHGSVQIQITDTGNGFPEDVLKELNSSRFLTPVDGHRIGITNALKRLRLFYKDGETAVTFSNLTTGGACVTILLPADTCYISSEEVKIHERTSY